MLEGVAVHTEVLVRTRRLDLEPIGEAHAARLFDLLRDERLYTFVPQDPPAAVEELAARFRRWARRENDAANELWLNYAVLLRDLRRYVGTVQATVREEAGAEGPQTRRRRALLAYMTFPDAWRQGFAHEACTGLLHVLRDAFEVERFEARVDTRNRASQALLESLGFENVRRIDGADTFKGATSDEFVFELDGHSLPSLRLELR